MYVIIFVHCKRKTCNSIKIFLNFLVYTHNEYKETMFSYSPQLLVRFWLKLVLISINRSHEILIGIVVYLFYKRYILITNFYIMINLFLALHNIAEHIPGSTPWCHWYFPLTKFSFWFVKTDSIEHYCSHSHWKWFIDIIQNIP